jgi:site-specific DNA-adenine methylase
MFSYYGSKSKIVKEYPRPKFDKIIEPFAGSARYALRYWEKEVLLVDKYEVIVKIWKWLQQCSPADIAKLPILKEKDDLRKYGLSEEEKLFMGFIIADGTFYPCNIATKFSTKGEQQKGRLSRIAEQLYKIKHWHIQHGCYQDIPNQEATWYIAPPYQYGGHKYVVSNKGVDYSHLAQWCQSRNGQVIVCENTKSDWLPFKPLVDITGSMFKTTEAIWTNHPISLKATAQTLF